MNRISLKVFCALIVLVCLLVPNGASSDQVFRLIQPNRTIGGYLGPGDYILAWDNSYIDVFFFGCSSGQIVSVYMESEDFDTYLFLVDPMWNYDVRVIQNDDAPGTTNSLISDYRMVGTGVCYIGANSYSAGMTGYYSLRLEF